MTDPQELFAYPAAGGDEIEMAATGPDDGQWHSGASGSDWVAIGQPTQRTRRKPSADLRSASVCW